MEMGEEKAQYQKEKFEFMEKLNSEKMEMIEKIGNLEKTIQADEQKIAKLREKSKNAEDGLLGSSMEIEKLQETIAKLNAQIQENNPEAPIKEGATEESRPNKEVGSKQDKKKISELEAYIADLTSKIDELKNVAPGEAQNSGETEEDVFGKGTGIYKSVSALTTHFKFKIGNAQRLIRLMVPSIGDLNRYNLMESLNGLTGSVLRNIACDIDVGSDPDLLDQLKQSGYKITDYKGGNVFALGIDSSDAALAVYDSAADTITGVYSNNEELTKLLSQAIMGCFVKGTKVN